jgi:hypothetical protein
MKSINIEKPTAENGSGKDNSDGIRFKIGRCPQTEEASSLRKLRMDYYQIGSGYWFEMSKMPSYRFTGKSNS